MNLTVTDQNCTNDTNITYQTCEPDDVPKVQMIYKQICEPFLYVSCTRISKKVCKDIEWTSVTQKEDKNCDPRTFQEPYQDKWQTRMCLEVRFGLRKY